MYIINIFINEVFEILICINLILSEQDVIINKKAQQMSEILASITTFMKVHLVSFALFLYYFSLY